MPTDSVLPQDQPNRPPQSHLLVLLVVLVLVLTSSLYYYLRVTYPSSEAQTPNVAPQSEVGQLPPSPTPSKPPYTLPSGPQTYRFSHGKDVTGPKVQVVTLDPLDPAPGSTQTITLEVDSDSPVQTVTVTIQTDHGDKPLTLALKSGDTLRGTYQTSHQADDTFAQRYALHYLLTSTSGTFDNIMYIR